MLGMRTFTLRNDVSMDLHPVYPGLETSGPSPPLRRCGSRLLVMPSRKTCHAHRILRRYAATPLRRYAGSPLVMLRYAPSTSKTVDHGESISTNLR